MNIKKMQLAAVAMTFTLGLAACDKPGPAENAGKEIDQVTEKAGEKIDQAMHKAGDEIDQASKSLSDQAATTGVALEDSAITAKVKSVILAEPGLKSLEISVDTVGGVVTLAGQVDSQQNSKKAEQVAGGVADVKKVINQLIIK